MTMHKTLKLRDKIDKFFETKKREEEYSIVLKIEWLQQISDSRIIQKRVKKDMIIASSNSNIKRSILFDGI